MVNSHRYYPYPVLSEVSDDYHDSSFLANVEYSYSQDFLEFSFKADTDNKGLFDLIDSDHAVFAFHMECPQTSIGVSLRSRALSMKPESGTIGLVENYRFVLSS